MKFAIRLIPVALLLGLSLATSACITGGPAASAQSQDDTWCSNHPKQCDNKDWCARNPDKCAIGSTGN